MCIKKRYTSEKNKYRRHHHKESKERQTVLRKAWEEKKKNKSNMKMESKEIGDGNAVVLGR